jgi:hypothetical protein
LVEDAKMEILVDIHFRGKLHKRWRMPEFVELKLVALIFVLAAAAVSEGCKSCNVSLTEAVTTHHYDTFRTGWNPREFTLNYANVGSSKFGLLTSVPLDDLVDTQPLVVPGVNITAGPSPGKHDVVYVATEGNTIYAIDASSGVTLLTTNLGQPVPRPLGCNNNGPNVGINGTPVIDVPSSTMYVIAYTLENGVPVYRIHALDLGTLQDKVSSVPVSGSHTLDDGSTFPFNATYQRQRPGLLEANGNVYAAFGSFCDSSADQSRGWILGWKTGMLAPLPGNALDDRLASSPNTYFLSSVWMSGCGVTADESRYLYFVTGNSDYSGTTWNGTYWFRISG